MSEDSRISVTFTYDFKISKTTNNIKVFFFLLGQKDRGSKIRSGSPLDMKNPPLSMPSLVPTRDILEDKPGYERHNKDDDRDFDKSPKVQIMIDT